MGNQLDPSIIKQVKEEDREEFNEYFRSQSMLTPISLKDSEVLESAQRMYELLNTLIETIDNYLDESD